MIISASRRTDIPAFYAEWFINRTQEGYCTVPNPFNPKQVSRISLLAEDVEAIVFWTRNPEPLMAHLPKLDDLELRYYFLFTLVNNPKAIDPYSPVLDRAVPGFQRLAGRIGPHKVVWRYDPIVLSSISSVDYHIDNFGTIAEKLTGSTFRVVISFVEEFRKTARRIGDLRRNGISFQQTDVQNLSKVAQLVPELVTIAKSCGIELYTCAQRVNLTQFGARPGKCIDDQLLAELFEIMVPPGKDSSQRRECGCIVSRDIGMYDSCLFGCSYCYATRNFGQARRNYRSHDPASPSLLGWHETMPVEPIVQEKICSAQRPRQLKLF